MYVGVVVGPKGFLGGGKRKRLHVFYKKRPFHRMMDSLCTKFKEGEKILEQGSELNFSYTSQKRWMATWEDVISKFSQEVREKGYGVDVQRNPFFMHKANFVITPRTE